MDTVKIQSSQFGRGLIYQAQKLISNLLSLIIAYSLLLTPYCFAQAPDTLWTKTYGGTSSDMGGSVQECASGGFIITGGTYSFGAGKNDVYLIRT
ncbi:hypothetical protein KAW50_06875, partial [candidate division WOR-3 bacterium]|nr:hypothetical protein [candidate division WOR-3 bacterium]